MHKYGLLFLLLLSPLGIAEDMIWYLHGDSYSIQKVQKCTKDHVTYLWEGKSVTVPIDQSRLVRYSELPVDDECVWIALKRSKTLSQDILSDQETVETQLGEVYLKTEFEPKRNREKYCLLVSIHPLADRRSSSMDICSDLERLKRSIPPEYEQRLLLLKFEQEKRTEVYWKGFMGEEAFRKLVNLDASPQWKNTIEGIYRDNQERYKRFHFVIGWAKQSQMVRGREHIEKHSENPHFLALPYRPMEVDRTQIEGSDSPFSISSNRAIPEVSPEDAEKYKVQIPEKFQHKIGYTQEYRLSLFGRLDREEYQELRKLQKATYWQEPLYEVYVLSSKKKSIQAKAILREPQVKNVDVPVFLSPEEGNINSSLRVLDHFYLFTRTKDKKWYLLGQGNALDPATSKIELPGWVREENLIFWTTGQSVWFDETTRPGRPLAYVYLDSEELIKAAKGGKHVIEDKENGSVRTLGQEIDCPYPNFVIKLPLLEQKVEEIDTKDGIVKIRALKVAYIAHNMKLALDAQKSVHEALEKIKKMATLEILLVLDGTGDTEAYAKEIFQMFGRILRTVEEASRNVLEGKPKNIPDPFLRELALLQIVPEVRIATLVYRDAQSYEPIIEKSTECNFYDFVETKEEFEKIVEKIVFSTGGGDQASHRKALRSIFDKEFALSCPGVNQKPSRTVNPTWSFGSSRTVILVGDVGQRDEIDRNWQAESFVENWKNLPIPDRFHFFALQFRDQRNTDGNRRFKAFADGVIHRLNDISHPHLYARYASLSRNDVVKEFETIWSNALEEMRKRRQELHRAIESGVGRIMTDAHSTLLELPSESMKILLAPSLQWNEEIQIPSSLTSCVFWDGNEKKVYLYKDLEERDFQELGKIPVKNRYRWIDTLKKLNQQRKENEMLQKLGQRTSVSMYCEGWVMEKNYLPNTPGYGKNNIQFFLYMNKTELGDIISKLNNFIEAFDDSIAAARIGGGGSLKLYFEKALKNKFGIDRYDTPFLEQSAIVLPGKFWRLTLNDIHNMSEANLKIIGEKASDRLGKKKEEKSQGVASEGGSDTMFGYRDDPKNWKEGSEKKGAEQYSYIPVEILTIEW